MAPSKHRRGGDSDPTPETETEHNPHGPHTLVNHTTGNTHDVSSLEAAKDLATHLGTDHYSILDANDHTVYRIVDGQVQETGKDGSTPAKPATEET